MLKPSIDNNHEHTTSGAMMPPGDAAAETLAEHLADQVLEACPDRHRNGVVDTVHTLLEELRPATALEAMLAAQMVGCHFITMHEMRHAVCPRVNDDRQQLHLQMAIKMQRTFVSQVEALLKLKGASHQRVLVEHVHRNES